jgi:hypothetical protein
VHPRGENFGKGENWLGLYECVDGHTRVFKASPVFREAHGPLLEEERVKIRVNIDYHERMCESEKCGAILTGLRPT